MPATDDFSRFQLSNISPLTHAVAVTPHDTNELSSVTRALYVGFGGNLKVTMQNGGDVTFVDVPTGTTLPIRCTKVFNTGTVASSILALW